MIFIGTKKRKILYIFTIDSYDFINLPAFSEERLWIETNIFPFNNRLNVPVIIKKQNIPKKNLNHNG